MGRKKEILPTTAELGSPFALAPLPAPPPYTAPLGWRRPTLEYFSPPATPFYPHALRRMGRPHPLACLFLWSWENGGINEASIRHASRVWEWGEGLRLQPNPGMPEKAAGASAASQGGGFPQTPFWSTLTRRAGAWEPSLTPTATHCRRPAGCRRLASLCHPTWPPVPPFLPLWCPSLSRRQDPQSVDRNPGGWQPSRPNKGSFPLLTVETWCFLLIPL